MDVDYNENDCPILPSLSDIIKSYSDAKAMQSTTEPTSTTKFDASNNNGFQPLENQTPDDTFAPPIHEPSTAPINLLKPTATGPTP
jgi:hypothetical protein